MESEPRLESLETSLRIQNKRDKRKILDQETKPVKDLIRGGTKIRVLPQNKSSLPPAMFKKKDNIRESFLKHRRQDQKNSLPGYRNGGGGARSFIRHK
jgi:hypothetical protein